MKRITQAWLDAAKDDLAVIEQIISRADLTHITAFHAQQCVEKCLKAVLEEQESPVKKTHSILQLIGLVSGVNSQFMDMDTTIPNLLDQLYTEARYPNEFGLLPNGKPSVEDAKDFECFARNLLKQIKELLA